MASSWGKGKPTGASPANGDRRAKAPRKTQQVDPTKPPQPNTKRPSGNS